MLYCCAFSCPIGEKVHSLPLLCFCREEAVDTLTFAGKNLSSLPTWASKGTLMLSGCKEGRFKACQAVGYACLCVLHWQEARACEVIMISSQGRLCLAGKAFLHVHSEMIVSLVRAIKTELPQGITWVRRYIICCKTANLAG